MILLGVAIGLVFGLVLGFVLRSTWFTDVLAFHRKFGQTIGERNWHPGSKLIAFRLSLIEEELAELKQALQDCDYVEAADAICDLIYVVIGTGIAFGMDLRPIWKEVQRSNMAKDGGGKRGDGKILKPEGWKPPAIRAALLRGKVLK